MSSNTPEASPEPADPVAHVMVNLPELETDIRFFLKQDHTHLKDDVCHTCNRRLKGIMHVIEMQSIAMEEVTS